MLVILTGGTGDDALPSYASQLSKRADFEMVLPHSDDIASYKPGSGSHFLTFHHHWEMLEEDAWLLSPDFKLEELFLASRGGLTVVLSSDSPMTDMIHRQALTSVTEMKPANIVSLARSLEAEVEPLNRWRHYIGYRLPSTLIICQPDRDLRRNIIGVVSPDDDWQSYSFASSGATTEELDFLWLTLDTPEILGVGRISPQVENWIETRGGTFQPL